MEVLRHFVIATACISTMAPMIDSSDVGTASVQRLLRMELLNRSLELLVLVGLYLKLKTGHQSLCCRLCYDTHLVCLTQSIKHLILVS
jgi:hypothetical protein